MRRLAALAVLVAAPLSLAGGLWFGSVEMPAGEWFSALAGGGSEASREILWSLRAPRTLSAFACGALLALSGALLQVLLRNPLADPSILGVSGGAGARENSAEARLVPRRGCSDGGLVDSRR